MENRDVPELYEVKALGFELSLNLAKMLSANPKSSQNAAILTLLFCQLREIKHLKLLERWLWFKVTKFIDNPPRDQSNQIDKVLITACCVYSRITTGKVFTEGQKRNLENYISYAADQNWFDDPFLAFYCYQIIEEIPICRTAAQFFKQNYNRFIERKNIPAIAQSLLVLDDQMEDIEKSRCYMIFTEKWSGSSNLDQGWILLGSSKSQDSEIVDMSRNVAQNITKHLNGYVEDFARNSLALDALVLMDDDISQIELDKYLQSLQIPMKLQKQRDELVIHLPFSEYRKWDSIESFSLFILLLSMSQTEWHEYIGVLKTDKGKLISILTEAKVDNGTLKKVTSLEMFVANILTILTTLIIGFFVFGFFIGAEIKLPQINFSQSDWRNIDVIIFGIGYVALIFTQLTALVIGKSAISYWLQITPIKQLLSLFRR